MSDSAKIQKNVQRKIIRNKNFIEKAEQLRPNLIETKTTPKNRVIVTPDPLAIHGFGTGIKKKDYRTFDYQKGDQFILDFGTHQVGYLSFNIIPVGSPPDAPLHLKLTLGEMPIEMAVPFSEYDGWISSSWLQEETLHVDILPNRIELPRRYSFRYVKFEILDTSGKYKVKFNQVECQAVTSADLSKLLSYEQEDPILKKIDETSIKTLQDCMQEVFEDGPKRDRRLWVGDLRLQALANYETFQNNDLVKRCLYLFAGVPTDEGQVSANLFIEPMLIPDDTYLFDYSLIFTCTLYDYYQATKDIETLEELWPTALKQIDLALERLDSEFIVKDDVIWWSFIDWHDQLNKQTPSQAVLIYTLRRAISLAQIIKSDCVEKLEDQLEKLLEASVRYLWDQEQQFFISGSMKQVSWASQIWMVLAEVLDSEKSRELINRLIKEKPSIGPTTPYLYHYLVDALLLIGEKGKAIDLLKNYWGGMIEDGADTFWELYDPENKDFSPYGSSLINSYCHAWSCTPTYFIRKYKL